MVDPGWCRTPGMRRYLTRGSLWGLALYLIMWPFWWLVLKSPVQGAQSFLYGAMEAAFERTGGMVFLKEVIEAQIFRDEVRDESAQKKLWEVTEKAIQALEKEGAARRAAERKEEDATKKAPDEKPAETTGKQPGSRRSRKAEKS